MIGTGAIGSSPLGSSGRGAKTVRLNLPAARVYRCFLGEALLPITSLQLRLRVATASYVSVVIPDAPTYADIIEANIGQKLVVEQGFLYADGSAIYEELAQCNVELITDQRGAKSQSITLSGYGDNATPLVVEVPLEGLQYYSSANGVTTLRVLPEPLLRAGDIGVVEGYSVQANLISTYIGISNKGIVSGFSEISNG